MLAASPTCWHDGQHVGKARNIHVKSSQHNMFARGLLALVKNISFFAWGWQKCRIISYTAVKRNTSRIIGCKNQEISESGKNYFQFCWESVNFSWNSLSKYVWMRFGFLLQFSSFFTATNRNQRSEQQQPQPQQQQKQHI